MTAAFQLCAEERGNLLMMLLIFLLSESRVLASASKGMILTPPMHNIKLSSCSAYKATGNYALSCGPEHMWRKTSCCNELSSDSYALARKGSFLDLSAAAEYKAACSHRGWEHADVLSACRLFIWCEWLHLPDINGDSATYPSRGFELTHSFFPREGAGWLVQPNLNWL